MLNKIIKPSIKSKLIIRFGILVAIFTGCMALTFLILNRSIQINNRIIYTYAPAIKKLETVKLNVMDSKSLINSWISNQSDNKHPNKERLREILGTDFPKSKKELLTEAANWEESEKLKIDTVFKRIDSLLTEYDRVMSNLNSFDSYSDPSLMFEFNPMIQTGGVINVKYEKIIQSLDAIIASHAKSSDQASKEMTESLILFKQFIIIIVVVSIILSVIITFSTVRHFTIPIQKVKDVLVKMGQGILPETKLSVENNEIGEMAESLNYLREGLRKTADYADKIGNGNLEASFKPLSEQDMLGNSLLEMGKKLKKLNEEDGKRNWVATGLAHFAQLLRESSDLQLLCDNVLSNLVKYVNANQGSLYLSEETEVDNESQTVLKLISCYAYDRKKFIKKDIYPGDGLVGQCYIEKDIIFLTDVPADYIRITSGLGEATPTSIVILPLVINDKIMGVLEIASFKVFDAFELEFVKKLCENIAGTVSNGKINQRTIKLLEDSRIAQQNMREKEEEMRQNLEELTATQEEMQRKENEYLTKIESLEKALTSK